MLLTEAIIEELLINAPTWPMMEMRAMVTPTAMRTIAILVRALPANVPNCE